MNDKDKKPPHYPDEELGKIYQELFETAARLRQGTDPGLVAASMMAIGSRSYKTIMTPEDYEKMMNEASVFSRARTLAMDYDEIVKKKKNYQYRGHTKGEWGCSYTGIIDLVQKKVTDLQKDKDGNVISYPIYNYIMVKR